MEYVTAVRVVRLVQVTADPVPQVMTAAVVGAAPVPLAIRPALGALVQPEMRVVAPLAMKWSAIAGAPMATAVAAVVVVGIPPCLTVPHLLVLRAAASSMTPI